MVSLLKDKIKKSLLAVWSVSLEEETIVITCPEDTQFGDLTCNIAFVLAKQLKKSPSQIAQDLIIQLSKDLPKEFSQVQAVAGYINFTYSIEYFQSQIANIITQGDDYGSLVANNQLPVSNHSVQIEFVSANPTGPLHIGNARGGPVGDVLANVLSRAGFKVSREYYHNDLGGQVFHLGESIYCRYLELHHQSVDFPEDGYQGDYVKDLAQLISRKEGDRWLKFSREEASSYFGKWAVDYFLEKALDFCSNLGIKFDSVYRESGVESSGKTEEAIELLKKAGVLSEKEGAIWLSNQDEFLRDRECVVVKSDGSYTYFSNDIGYHWDKYERGFDKVIDVWGANHHGHVLRMKSALQALGISPERFEVVLYQWVSLIKDGKKVSMSKRSGNFVMAQELLDEIGPDAFRFFYLSRGADKPLELDINLAKEQSNKNPVYYVQYAHARLCSLLSKARESNISIKLSEQPILTELAEANLIRQLLKFPLIIKDIALSGYQVNKLAVYSISLADSFHRFYESCPVLAVSSTELAQSRLALVQAVRVVLKNTLSILGISAPEKM